MEHAQLVVGELFIAKPDGRSAVRVFVSSPTPLEETNLGRVFGVFEIESRQQATSEIIDVLVDEFTQHYYQSELFEVAGAFESALQHVNKKISQIVEQIGPAWLDHAHVIFGVHRDHHLIMSPLGRVAAFLIHRDKIVDIIETRAAAEIQPEHALSSTLSGEIPTGATVLVATERILDYLSREKIKQVLSQKPAEEACDEFASLLNEDTTNTNFAALVLTVHHRSQETTFAAASLSDPLHPTVDSMSRLVQKERHTEELLTSSLWPGIKKSVAGLMTHREKKERVTSGLHPDFYFRASAQEESISAQGRRTSGAGFQKVIETVWRGFGKALLLTWQGIRVIIGGFIRLAHRQGWSGSRPSSSFGRRLPHAFRSDSLLATASRGVNRVQQWFRGLSLLQKIFFGLAIIVFFVFAQSVVNRGGEKISSAQEQSSEQTMRAVERLVNEGKAAMLYDQEKARGLLRDAQTQLASLEKDSKIFRDRGVALEKTIHEQLGLANNVTIHENLSPVLDFTTISPSVSVGSLLLLGASIFGFDDQQESVYRGNLENRGVTISLNAANATTGIRATSKASPGTGVVLRANQQLALYNPVSPDYTPLKLGYGNGDHTIADIIVYGVRLYVLDRAKNQIFRHQRAEETFGDGTAWLTDDTVDLSGAVSMAIDGDIYVLKENGTVLRFRSGVKDDSFQLGSIDPVLMSGRAIVTDEQAKNIYILDPSASRVVVVAKDGKLIAQHSGNIFSEARDLLVEEAEHRMFILAQSKVYEIPLESPK